MLPILCLPYETRQVVANLEGNRYLASRYFYVSSDSQERLETFEHQGEFSSAMIKGLWAAMSLWISQNIHRLHRETPDLSHCFPYDILLFLKEYMMVPAPFLEMTTQLMEGLWTQKASLMSPLVTAQMTLVLRLLGTLQMGVLAKEEFLITSQESEIAYGMFPEMGKNAFQELSFPWQGLVRFSILWHDFKEKFGFGTEIPPLHQIARAIFYKKMPSLQDKVQMIGLFYGVKSKNTDEYMAKLRASLFHIQNMPQDMEVLFETRDIVEILWKVSQFELGKDLSSPVPFEFLDKICLELQQPDSGVAGRIILKDDISL